jgi:hypothetical protein
MGTVTQQEECDSLCLKYLRKERGWCIGSRYKRTVTYLVVLISLWLFLFFLFAAQPKESFLDGLKKLEQQSHKCVELRRGYVK